MLRISACRICDGNELEEVFSLGEMAFTGVFPLPEEEVPRGPLTLLLCHTCGLLQLAHNYDPTILYGPTYGYRSGLNASMVAHLTAKAHQLTQKVYPTGSDVILDIGSNDGTLLSAYKTKAKRVGLDPNIKKWSHFYPEDVLQVDNFFPCPGLLGDQKAKIITSVAMFYDLQDPVGFAHEVVRILHDDGIWHIEQAYLPTMLAFNGFDTICHEHLEYYSLQDIKNICNLVGLKIVDLSFNTINGGSFAVTLAHKDSFHEESSFAKVKLRDEASLGLRSPGTYRQFKSGVDRMMKILKEELANAGLVLGYGASTKGNVLLQYANITLPVIAEINPDKFGHVTPGTNIPIVSEAEAKAMNPDAFLVLPWHFYDGIVRRESEYLRGGGKLILPLPNPRIISE